MDSCETRTVGSGSRLAQYFVNMGSIGVSYGYAVPVVYRVTLTELKYIVAVAEERHFGRAAARVHVSQPSLSASVAKLEDELGVRIFERGKRGVALTRVGEEVVAQARRALEESTRVKAVAQQGR